MILAVVSDYKDTNFWKQFTTPSRRRPRSGWLFQTTKIQTFESNSQRKMLRYGVLPVVSDYKDTNFWKQFTTEWLDYRRAISCFRLQRYKLLKAIHNRVCLVRCQGRVVSDYKDTNFWKQFTTGPRTQDRRSRCFRLQRYKLLKAIHNGAGRGGFPGPVVSDYKDTNFWKQFTTDMRMWYNLDRLFQTTKIQTFESNSQP